MKKIMALLAMMAFAALALAACGSSGKSSSSTAASKSASVAGGGYGSSSGSSSNKTAAIASSSGVVKVGMVDDAFQPKVISGKPGSTIKVELRNTGSHEHNFKIDSQKQADADVAPGKSATVTVKIPTSGSLQFYCEYHKGLGMIGTVKAA